MNIESPSTLIELCRKGVIEIYYHEGVCAVLVKENRFGITQDQDFPHSNLSRSVIENGGLASTTAIIDTFYVGGFAN